MLIHITWIWKTIENKLTSIVYHWLRPAAAIRAWSFTLSHKKSADKTLSHLPVRTDSNKSKENLVEPLLHVSCHHCNSQQCLEPVLVIIYYSTFLSLCSFIYFSFWLEYIINQDRYSKWASCVNFHIQNMSTVNYNDLMITLLLNQLTKKQNTNFDHSL